MSNDSNIPTMTFDNDIWLDKQDISQLLHISPRTLQTWRSLGWLPYVKNGRKIYYRKSELERFMKRGRKR